MPERALAVASALRNRLYWGLHSATMQAGDRLPSLRELAVEFDVDTRTALRACHLLQEEGLIELRERSGMYLRASTPPASYRASGNAVADLLALGYERGVAPAVVVARLTERFVRNRACVLCVDTVADHAQSMCQIVSRTFGVDAVAAGIHEVEEPGEDNPLRQAVAVLATVFHFAGVSRAAAAHGKPAFIMTMESTFGRELSQRLVKHPVYLVGVDRRWADRAAAIFHQTEIAPNLQLLVIGEDDLDRIPDSAEVFVTPPVAAVLHELPIANRARVVQYHLAPGEASGLIQAILAAPIG